MSPLLELTLENTPNWPGEPESPWEHTVSCNAQHQPQRDQESFRSTEFLIIGAGPAGASLACFLASHGE